MQFTPKRVPLDGVCILGLAVFSFAVVFLNANAKDEEQANQGNPMSQHQVDQVNNPPTPVEERARENREKDLENIQQLSEQIRSGGKRDWGKVLEKLLHDLGNMSTRTLSDQ